MKKTNLILAVLLFGGSLTAAEGQGRPQGKKIAEDTYYSDGASAFSIQTRNPVLQTALYTQDFKRITILKVYEPEGEHLDYTFTFAKEQEEQVLRFIELKTQKKK